MATQPANLKEILKEFKHKHGTFAEWRNEMQNSEAKAAIQAWVDNEVNSGIPRAMVIQKIEKFVAEQKPGNYRVNGVLAEALNSAIELSDNPNQKATLAYNHAVFVEKNQTTAIKEYGQVMENYSTASQYAHNANRDVNYGAADQKAEMAMREIIDNSNESNQKYQAYIDSKVNKKGGWVPETSELDIFRMLVDKRVATKADVEKGFDRIYAMEFSESTGAKQAQILIADRLLDIQPDFSGKDADLKIKNFLQLAHDFEESTSSHLKEASTRYYQAVLTMAEEHLHDDEGIAFTAAAALAAGRLFVASTDPKEKQTLVAKVADYVMQSKSQDFAVLLTQFETYFNESNPINLLQNKELRNAVATHIKNTKSPEEVKDLITQGNMVVKWLETPTSTLGLSKYLGGTDSYKILESATLPAPPLEIRAFPEAAKPAAPAIEPPTAPPSPSSSATPAAPIIEPQRTVQKSFLEDKVINNIKNELPQWSMQDADPKNSAGMKEMRNGNESYLIQKSGLTTKSQDANTYEAMLLTIKIAHQDVNPKPTFEITLNKEDPKVKAEWEKAITKVFGNEGQHIKVKVELPAATATPAAPQPLAQDATNTKGMGRK